MTKTVKAIRAEAEEQIYQIVYDMLSKHRDQQQISYALDVSTSWVSRFVDKHRARLKSDGVRGWGKQWR